MRQIDTFFLPNAPVPPKADIAIIIDVLRASTTICTALENGAAAIFPCLEIADALAVRQRFPSQQVLCGGERHGVRIEEFDLGNSPLEYEEKRVRDQTIAFTTTNGTRALFFAKECSRIVICCFANLSAVSHFVNPFRRVAIICAGTDQQVTLEDCLAAGAVVASQVKASPGATLNDESRLAFSAWNQVVRQIDRGDSKCLFDLCCQSRGGKNLLELDREADIRFATVIDRYGIVPTFDSSNGKIVRDQLAARSNPVS